MKFNPVKHWNKSHEGHIKDRLPSNYAIDKEKSFPRNSLICDLGGGDGADSLYFLEKGHSVYLYDISDSALKEAERKANLKNFNSRLVTGTIDLSKDDIPSKENLFDIVYSRLALHYFYQKRMEVIFKEIFRVLKINGTAYFVVKSPDDEKEMNFLKSDSKEVEPGVFVDEKGMIKTRFTKEQYKNILEETSVKNYKIHNYVEYFGEQKTYVKSGAEKLQYIEIVIRK